jgi:ribosome maturation factor RimP
LAAACSRSLAQALEAALGEEVAGAIMLEVSSPGADRLLQLPGDLKRFGQLPLAVDWAEEGGSSQSKVGRPCMCRGSGVGGCQGW